MARILHSSSKKDGLPWHRVVNRHGKISLRPGNGYERQLHKLDAEGIVFDENEMIDFDLFLWVPLNL